jgi:hypothetical protein
MTHDVQTAVGGRRQEVEHSADALATRDVTGRGRAVVLDERVVETLMIALGVVSDVRRGRASPRRMLASYFLATSRRSLGDAARRTRLISAGKRVGDNA